MPNFPRTDLAVEAEAIHRSAAAVTELPGVRAEETNRRGFSVTEVHVLDAAGENALCKPIGDYYTLALDPLLRREDDAFENAAQTLAELLRGVLPLMPDASVLVVGLGNRAITPDAVGPDAIDSVMVTRHLREQLPEHFGQFRPVAALAAGVAPDRIRRSIYAFAPVEHRLEPVRETDGVLWINDSKATNVDSVWYALESMKRPVVWIAGGTDKGNDYEPLKAFAREKVHTLVCMGVDNRKLVESFTGVVPEVISTASLDEAMEAARRAARPGDAVLLSPACASFDLFRNYEQRGELFKKWVGEHC